MADTLPRMARLNPALSRRLLSLEGEDGPRIEPLTAFPPRLPFLDFMPPPVAPPTPPFVPEPVAPPPEIPGAPSADPFAELPYPNPGDRIKAEDFRKLAQALRIAADAHALAGAVFALPFGVVRPVLRAEGYEIARVVSVGGAELAGPDDPALDARKVVGVAPLALGQPRVGVVVTETPQTADRRMPNLLGLTYRQAAARLQDQVGDLLASGGPMPVPQLVGRTLTEAQRGLRP